MGRKQITVRLDDTPYRKLLKMSAGTRLSVNQIAGALLIRALAEGWTVQPGGTPEAVPPATPLTSNQGREQRNG